MNAKIEPVRYHIAHDTMESWHNRLMTLTQLLQEAWQPKVAFCEDMDSMREEAKKATEKNVAKAMELASLLEAELCNIVTPF